MGINGDGFGVARPVGRWRSRMGLSAAVVAMAFVAACAAPPPPVAFAPPPPPPSTAPAPTTTTPPSAPPAAPGSEFYAWGAVRARSIYKLTYVAGTPQQVIDSFHRAASAVAEQSGITFVSDTASTGANPVASEIRVRIGALCSGNENGAEAGCARRFSSGNQLISADVSVTTLSSNSSYLDAVSAHELGHSIGLDHVESPPQQPQIMNPIVGDDVLTYQNGDRAGLRVVGANKYDSQLSSIPSAMLFASVTEHAIEAS